MQLINADPGPMRLAAILRAVTESRPDAVLIGHSGSTSAHPTVVGLARAIRAALPELDTVNR